MTIANTTSRINFTGTGSVSTYSFNFTFLTADQIRAFIIDTSSVKTEVLDFRLWGNLIDWKTKGSTMELSSPLGRDYQLIIERHTVITQSNSMRNAGRLDLKTLEDGMDKLTRISQEADRNINDMMESGAENDIEGDLDMKMFKIVNLLEGEEGDHAVNKEQLDSLKKYTDIEISNTVTDGKQHIDSLIDTAREDGKQYIDDLIDTTREDGKQYIDTKIANIDNTEVVDHTVYLRNDKIMSTKITVRSSMWFFENGAGTHHLVSMGSLGTPPTPPNSDWYMWKTGASDAQGGSTWFAMKQTDGELWYGRTASNSFMPTWKEVGKERDIRTNKQDIANTKIAVSDNSKRIKTNVQNITNNKRAIEEISNNDGFTGMYWKSLNSERKLNKTYTNTTGKSINIAISVQLKNTVNVILKCDGVMLFYAGNFSSDSMTFLFSAIIPNGNIYSLESVAGNNIAITQWSELR